MRRSRAAATAMAVAGGKLLSAARAGLSVANGLSERLSDPPVFSLGGAHQGFVPRLEVRLYL